MADVPILAESRPVIAFDNRGVGRSDRVPDPYSTPEMADDAIAVLDGAGFERAHVYGISLGGMIAQEIVLRHPDRVAGLVLGATAAGGPDAISPDETTLAFFRRRARCRPPRRCGRRSPTATAPRCAREHAQRIADDLEQRLRYPVEPEPYGAQLTELWPGASHIYPTDEPEADRSVARFLAEAEDGAPASWLKRQIALRTPAGHGPANAAGRSAVR